jgi:CHASE2 domain-containing sensor protein
MARRSWIRVRHVPFWRYYLRHGLRTILAITAIMFLLEQRGCLHRMEMAGLDSFVRFKAPEYSNEIVVVEITDEDYEKTFHSTSPLDADSLARLISNIRSARPKLVAIDIDTSDQSFRKLARQGCQLWPDVIWACVPRRPHERDHPEHALLASLEPVAGGLMTDFRRIGVPVFPVDSDGFVRKYRRQFDTSKGHLPSLSWSIARQYDPAIGERGEEALFNFAGDRYAFPVIQAREFLGKPDPDAWSKVLGRKIVLVGGDYAAARDSYMTALGEMAGVELIAHATQSDLSHGGIGEGNLLVSAALDVLFGTMLVYVFFRLTLVPAFLIGMLVLVPLCLAGSWMSFKSLAYWVSFVPLVLGMVIHQLYDYAKEQHEEIERLRKLLGE